MSTATVVCPGCGLTAARKHARSPGAAGPPAVLATRFIRPAPGVDYARHVMLPGVVREGAIDPCRADRGALRDGRSHPWRKFLLGCAALGCIVDKGIIRRHRRKVAFGFPSDL